MNCLNEWFFSSSWNYPQSVSVLPITSSSLLEVRLKSFHWYSLSFPQFPFNGHKIIKL